METCQNYGKLYAFFLEFCRLFIDDELDKNGVPKNGRDLYYYLQDEIANSSQELYEAVIRNSPVLQDFQSNILLPQENEINVTRLYCIMYLKILRLLGRGLPIPKENCLTRIRNYLCHAPMKLICKDSAADFYEDYDRIKMNYGIMVLTKNWCKSVMRTFLTFSNEGKMIK